MNNRQLTSAESDLPTRPAPPALATLSGVAGAAVGLGFGEFMEGAFESIPSLVVAVSELLSDYTPGDVVAFSIANVGTSQKSLLTAGIVIGSLALGGALGRFLERGRRDIALTGFALFGLAGGWAAARNPLSPAFGSWVVAITAAAMAASVTLLLASRLRPRPLADRRATPADPALQVRPERVDAPSAAATTRRAFFGLVAGAGAAAVAMVSLGRTLRGQSAAEQFLETNTLRPATPRASTTGAPTAPQPTSASTPSTSSSLPMSSRLAALDTLDEQVAGVSSYLTPNQSFYRIDTAFGQVPQVDPNTWRLRFTGMVDNPYEVTFEEIQSMDLSDHVITLSCVSNEVGGDLVGNAVWTGVPLSVLLDRAGVQAGADQVVGRSVDDWTAGFPTGAVYDGRNAVLAVGMNDEFLPTRHGFPARLVVAGLYGYVSAVKWIEEIRLTTWDGFDGYWVPRGWSKEGPMKTQSRIDVPSTRGRVAAGEPTPIAGIAWAPTRGIQRVEVDIDDEGWLPCRLGEAVGDESWVQWHYEWTPAPGRHEIRVRATDGDGAVQNENEVPPRPNGAEGWHTVTVTAGT